MEPNPRIRETKRLLYEALLRLLESMPIGRINVRQLCAEAGVNRSTFYRYYRTTYDLLLEMHETAIEAFEAVEYSEAAGDRANLTAVMATIARAPALNLALNEVYMRAAFAGRMAQSRKDFIRRIFLDRMPERMALYFSAVVTAVIQRWLNDAGREPPEAVAALLISLAKGTGAWEEREAETAQA